MTARFGRVLSLLLCAGAAHAAETEIPLDVVFRNDGTVLAGRVSSIETLFLKLNVQRTEKQPKTALAIPLVDVHHVDFGEGAMFKSYLGQATHAPADIERYWRERKSLIHLPESTAGALGLHLAKLFLDASEESARLRALDLFRLIEDKDWNPDRRALARQGRWRALFKLGRADEALAEARGMAGGSEDPHVLIEANYLLAEAGMEELRGLKREHPRWQEDESLRAETDRLYQRVLDFYLFSYLFYGSEAEEAARGLWGAIGAYEFAGQSDAAAETARDIVMLYPKTPEAAQAQEFLNERETKEMRTKLPGQPAL